MEKKEKKITFSEEIDSSKGDMRTYLLRFHEKSLKIIPINILE